MHYLKYTHRSRGGTKGNPMGRGTMTPDGGIKIQGGVNRIRKVTVVRRKQLKDGL